MIKKTRFFFSLLFIFPLVSCDNNTSPSNEELAKNSPIKQLVIIDQELGNGNPALKNSRVAVHYSGWLYDDNAENKKGALFDSSRDLGEPLVFQLGKKRVIKGWDEGIVGMKLGGKRTLLIPSDMAYGAKRIGTARTAIPANSALVFDVELIDLE